jgi:hypothetical protein
MTAGGALGVWATGFVASEPDVDFDDLPIFLVDCRTREGQSGSPVIVYGNGGMFPMQDGSTAVMGEVIRFLGIYSGRIRDASEPGTSPSSDLGIVWKAHALRELVDSIK